jgi:uncharacterized glyoxalase superfamily protein PhnB
MASTPPDGSQRIVPMLAYADAPAAIEFLCKAFGFEERFRMEQDGQVGHAELGYQGNVVMLASAFSPMGFVSPQDLPGPHAQLFCYVDDIDAHFARARSAGATVATEPTAQHGSRMYRAVDPEGHCWIFATNLDEASA